MRVFPLKPDLWWILAKKQSFLGLKTFLKKKKPPKSLETTLAPRWFQNYLCETYLKPLWFHKKRPFPKSHYIIDIKKVILYIIFFFLKTKMHFFCVIHFLFLKNLEFFKIVTQTELVNKKNRTWFWLLKAKNWFSLSFSKTH